MYVCTVYVLCLWFHWVQVTPWIFLAVASLVYTSRKINALVLYYVVYDVFCIINGLLSVCTYHCVYICMYLGRVILYVCTIYSPERTHRNELGAANLIGTNIELFHHVHYHATILHPYLRMYCIRFNFCGVYTVFRRLFAFLYLRMAMLCHCTRAWSKFSWM
jgi:hypothetical protein